MRKQTYLQVPEPCQENWSEMSPVQQGRFCQSCCKTVVDFSHMTDKQILDALAKAAGKTCGRFSSEQLNRPMVKEIPYSIRPYKMFAAALVPAFILTGTASCQDGRTKGKVSKQDQEVTILMGDTVMMSPASAAITGTILYENDEPAAGATVMIKGTRTGTVAGGKGSFSLVFPEGTTSVTLAVNIIGYKTKEVVVKKKQSKPFTIKLDEQDVIVVGMILPEIVEDGIEEPFEESGRLEKIKPKEKNRNKTKLVDSKARYPVSTEDAISDKYKIDEIKVIDERNYKPVELNVTCNLQGMVGGLAIVQTVTLKDTAKTFVQKLVNNEMFQVYPNPVAKSAGVNLTFKKPGEYSVQLFDNSGKLYLQKELKVEGSKQPFQFMLPMGMSTGIYYLKAINTSTKKQFVDKIIVR